MSTTKEDSKSQMYLDELEIGVTGFMIVMVCRIWDVNAATGRYLSTDFVMCDAKGNIMHATTRANVVHNFLKLNEGGIYYVKNFSVQPNKDEFRIFMNAPFSVKFDGETSVRKVFVKSDGFITYLFELVELENLEVTNTKYLIDVIGYVTNVAGLFSRGPGQGHLISILLIPVRVTLWGGLGEKFIEKTCHVRLYPFVRTHYRLYLSSSSSTLIIDDDSIPALKQMKTNQSGVETGKETLLVDFSKAKAGTLENLLMWGRNRKNDAAIFNCEVRIDKVWTKKGWNYPSCGGENVRKPSPSRTGIFGVTHASG
nr:hypothetical protein [Tanacetum cinerariifolium]